MDGIKVWCKSNPLLCIGLIVALIVVVVVVLNMTKKYLPEKFEFVAPSVLVEKSTADSVGRNIRDVARDRHGMTIRDYEIEAAFLQGQTV